MVKLNMVRGGCGSYGLPVVSEFRKFYLKPSFLYPAASVYQFASGIINRFNQGLLSMKLEYEGADMMLCCLGLRKCRGTEDKRN